MIDKKYTDPRFAKVPLEDDTKLLSQRPAHLGDYPACYQQWIWETIYGESLILVAEDVAHLSEVRLVAMLRESGLLTDDKDPTFKISGSGFLFLNFNFLAD